MSKINQLIQLKDLANAYSALIGNIFNIKVNVETEVDPLRSSGIMLATRQPYKIDNIKAESLQVALRFYVCCENEEEYNETIKILSQLVGLNKGNFTSNEKTFKYYSFLDFARPLSDPEINSGKFYQTLELMGTCLVTQTAGGVLIGNEVETEIAFNVGTENELSGKIEVLSATSALVKTQEAPQMVNKQVGGAINNSQLFSYSYTILVLKNAICERLVKALENIEPIGVNEAIRVVDKYPAFTGEAFSATKTTVLTGAQINRNAGAFTNILLTLQDKLELPNEPNTESGSTGSGSGGGSGRIGQPSTPTLPTYPCTVNFVGIIDVTNIVGNYAWNQDGTLSCDVGTIISVSISGTRSYLTVEGATAVSTSSSFVVSPKTYDVTINAVSATLTHSQSNGNVNYV